MTNKQAIDLIHACMHINNAEILDARDKACIALDKQEPMKVLKIEEMINLACTNEWTYCGICPNCNEGVYIDEHKNFCGNCGQKLDWRQKND